jgi:hypothetical protein
MKKVININFQGRVTPIEEVAYEVLQQYTASLRNYFANEEGRDEIINDIEGRIAELFGEILKKRKPLYYRRGCTGNNEQHGRPEDFDDDEAKVQSQLSSQSANSGSKASTRIPLPPAPGNCSGTKIIKYWAAYVQALPIILVSIPLL